MPKTLLVNLGNMGAGDYLFYVLISIYLYKHNIVNKVYIVYTAVHFNWLTQHIICHLITSNELTNVITLIGDIIYKIPNMPFYVNYMSIDEIQNDTILSNIPFLTLSETVQYISINPGNWFSDNQNTGFYYTGIVNYFKIPNYVKMCDIIHFEVQPDIDNACNILYEQLCEKLRGNKYILVYHCIERDQYNFGFRDYPYDFNKHNYPIINMCMRPDGIQVTNNEYFINEILTYFPDMWLQNKILEEAEEIHFFDSFPLHYCTLYSSKHKDKFINKKMVIYPRYTPDWITSIKNVGNLKEHYWQCNGVNVSLISTDTFYATGLYEYYTNLNFEYNNMCRHGKDIHLSQFSKILPILTMSPVSGLGILHKSLCKDINFIEIDLKNVSVNTLTQISGFILSTNNCLNILLLKTCGDYYLKHYKFERTTNLIMSSIPNNYAEIEKSLIEFIDFFYKNLNIHYIFPYKDDKDADFFKLKIAKACEFEFKDTFTLRYPIVQCSVDSSP
jgi:hypothetical protein